MGIRPLGTKVLLIFPAEGRLENGVWVPCETTNRMDAKVFAVGDGVSDDIRVGATVIADRLDGVEVTIDGVKYRRIEERDIRAVVEGGE